MGPCHLRVTRNIKAQDAWGDGNLFQVLADCDTYCAGKSLAASNASIVGRRSVETRDFVT
jgi:hypothetical protein